MKKIIYFLIFIIFIVTFPLFKPWYIFSIDFILSPNWWTPKIWENVFWLWYFIKFLNFIWIPAWFFQKIIIILTFFLPIFWLFLLLKSEIKNKYAFLFWFLFLIFNPFFYWRFIDWQLNVYFSYALFPLFLYFSLKTFENPNFKNILIISFFSLFLSLTSLHNVVFIFFIILLFFIFYFEKKKIFDFLKIIFFIFLINLTWFIPLFLSKKSEKFNLVNQISSYSYESREIFKAQKWDISTFLNIASLNWYWWEWSWRFFPVNKENFWFLFFFLFFLLSLKWFFSKIEKSDFKKIDKIFISLFIISFIFAIWETKSWFSAFINDFMYNYFPMYSWMREPHKWVIFLTIVYAYFWAIWVNEILSKINFKKYNFFIKNFFWICMILIPIFYVPKTLFWFYWQISIKDYPDYWREVKEIYKKIPEKKNCDYKEKKLSVNCYNSLLFPWHGYLTVSFTEKNVWSWIIWYFWENILYWDNIEFYKIYTSSNRLESKIIEKYIWPNWIFYDWIDKNKVKNFLKDLKWIWIESIFLLKEVDYLKYLNLMNFLEKEKFIKKIIEKENIIFYEII